MRCLWYAVVAVALLAEQELPAQLRPVDPSRPCDRLPRVSAAVDTTIDVGGGKPPAWLRPTVNDGPVYPTEQRNARVPGEVRVSFTVDTAGKIIRGTADVVAESDRAFSRSVCEFLQRAHYAPVVLDGHRRTVRVINQRFLFETR